MHVYLRRRFPRLLPITQLRTFSLPDFDPNADYYKILGISPTASDKEIKAQYYKLAHEYHPDKTGGSTEAKFKDISAAYDVLGGLLFCTIMEPICLRLALGDISKAKSNLG